MTSKCHTLADLGEVANLSFGWRGEALASLAQTSLLSITSRHQDSERAITKLVRGSQVQWLAVTAMCAVQESAVVQAGA